MIRFKLRGFYSPVRLIFFTIITSLLLIITKNNGVKAEKSVSSAWTQTSADGPNFQLHNSNPYVKNLKPLFYNDNTNNNNNSPSNIFTSLPVELPKSKKLGFLLGLNQTIALVSAEGNLLSYLSWSADLDAIADCQGSRRSYVLDCHNLIRLIEPVGERTEGSYRNRPLKADQFLVCGSFASQTRCRVVHLNANKILSWGSSVREGNDDDSDSNIDNQQIDQTRETIFKEKDHGTEYFVPRLSRRLLPLFNL